MKHDKAMNELRDLKNDRNKLITDAQQILLNKPDAEKRQSAHKMLDDARQIELDIDALEKAEASMNEERAKNAPNRPNVGEAAETAVTESKEQRAKNEAKAFKNFLMSKGQKIDERYMPTHQVATRGRDLETGEYRDITTSGYGQLIPQSFYPVLTEAKKSYGQILNVVTDKRTADGTPMKYALINDTGNSVALLTEGTAASETDPTSVGGSILSVDWATTGLIKISLPELQDSYFDVTAWVKKAFGIRYYRGLAGWVTNGNSSNVASIVPTASGAIYTTSEATSLVWADVAGAYASLDPAFEADAAWSFNTATRGAFLATTDSLGRPLYIPAPTAETFDMILGKRVIINTFMPSIGAGNVPVLYGDHTAYLLRTVEPELAVSVLDQVYMPQGEIGVIGFFRVGGVLLDPAATSAANHPLLAVKNAAS